MKAVVTGFEKVDKALRAYQKEHGRKSINKAVRRGTRAATKIVLREAKARMPWDTGRLEESLVVRSLKRSRVKMGHRVIARPGEFESGEFYGFYPEYGTMHQEAQPALRPALYNNQARLNDEVGVELRKLLRV